jgi:hypothetical protein
MTEEKARSLASPEAALEKIYIDEYLREKGYSIKELSMLSDEESTRLMTEACLYAAFKLEDLESRARLHTTIQHATDSL